MIDWVSIVRHSRRRFSDYMFAVPAKIRKRRRAKRHTDSLGTPNKRAANNAISRNSENAGGGIRGCCRRRCCCWNHVSPGKHRKMGLDRSSERRREELLAFGGRKDLGVLGIHCRKDRWWRRSTRASRIFQRSAIASDEIRQRVDLFER